MLRLLRYGLIISLALFLFAPGSYAGMVRVAKRLNYLDIYSGLSKPVGKYDGWLYLRWNEFFPPDSRRSPKIAGDEIYEQTVHFGINYGQLRNNHVAYSIGFRYTRAAVRNRTIIPGFGSVGLGESGLDMNLYDVTFDLNYFFLNLNHSQWSPYVGLGVAGGMLVLPATGKDPETGNEYASEGHVRTAARANFGFDIKIWANSKDRAFLSLTSQNSIDLAGSQNRPKYLNIGAAVRYWFRP